MGLWCLAAAFVADANPPSGGISPLAWAIIGALSLAVVTAVPALWYRGNKIQDTMYEDLKKCNAQKTEAEEELLGFLKLLRLGMEQSKGGKKK